MSKRVVPAEVHIFCDRCGAEKDGEYSNEFFSGEMHLKCEDRVTGPLGESAGGTSDYDLCGVCMREFLIWMGNYDLRNRSL